MDYEAGVPVVDPETASNLHPLELFQQLQEASMPGKAPSMPSVPNAPSAPQGDGIRGLLRMLAPVLGGLAMGSGAKQTGFLNGYSQGQQIADEEKQRKAQQEQQRARIAADFVQKISDQADQITDPAQWSHFVDTADANAARAKLTQPGEVKNQLAFNFSGKSAKQLKELTAQLDAFDKAGYNLDDLAASGSVMKLSDGTPVPISMAMTFAQTRPVDAKTGKPIGKPAKVAATEEERYIAKWAKENGYNVDDLTTDQELAARSAFRAAGNKPPAPPHLSPGGVDAQFNDLVELWKLGNPGKEPPAEVRTKLRVQARKEIGQADDRTPISISIPGMPGMSAQERVESAADDIIANRMAPSQLATFFTGMGKESASQLRSLVMQRVKQKQPDFNFAQAEANYKFGSAAGTQGTVRFLDNIEKTLPVLQQASDDFKRSGVRVINKALLASKSQFGSTDVVKFEFARNILADEIAKILQGGGTGSGTSDAKLRQAQDLLSGDMTPDQFSTALATAKELLSTRRGSLTSGTFMEKKPADAGGDAASALAILEARRKKKQGGQ